MLIVTALLLTLLVKSDQPATTPPTDNPFYHIPFDNYDQIKPNTIFQRFPERKLLLRPEILSHKLLSLPWDLRSKVMYFSVTAFNRSVVNRCHTNSCWLQHEFTHLIERYVSQSSIKGIIYIIIIVRDECHVRLIHEYLYNQQIKEPQYSRTLQHLSRTIKTLPIWMMSMNLKNPLQKQNILIPDSWMLFKDFNNEKRKAQEGSRLHPWNSKINKIFWRGVDSGVSYDYVDYWSDIAHYFPRAELIRYSRDNPEIVDARFSAIYHGDEFKSKLRQMGLALTSGQVSVQDHIKYKYLISVDGWTAAWFRPQWIMSSNSLFVKQESFKVEWFYNKLIPKKHYYPVAEDLSDLLEVYKYMEEHQEQMQNITKQANQFAQQNFGRGEVETAFFQILQQYINHQNFHSVFEPLMWPGRNFEDVLEKFNDNDREKILPSIGQIHLCKEQAETVQIEIPPLTCKFNKSQIPPYFSMALIGLSFLYFFTRFRIICLVKGVKSNAESQAMRLRD